MNSSNAHVFQERDILVASDETARWRVVLKAPEDCWLYPMNDRLALPEWRNTHDVQAEVDAGELLIQEPEAVTLTAAEKARAAERFKKFAPILADPERPELRDAVLTTEGRVKAFNILKATTYVSLTRKIFMSTVRKWWSGGQTDDCLNDDYGKCGRIGVDIENLEDVPLADAKRHFVKKALEIERSRRPTRKHLHDHTVSGMPRQRLAPTSPPGVIVDRLVLRVFHEYYKWKRKERGRSVKDAYDRLCKEVLVDDNADGSKRPIAARAHPKYRVFEDWHYALVPYSERRKAKVGDKNYSKNEREETGNERSKARRVGVKASGDATIWNIAIVTRLHGRRIIGPPVVFRIRCKRSGMLLGIAVSLVSASWTVAAAAIANCLEDKVAFCAKYGITIKSEDWPVKGLPAEFEFDRGETDNGHPEPFAAKTGVRLRNLQGGRPDMKPGVESDFNTLQIRLNGKTPAASVKDWEHKQHAAWKLEAELDIHQFMKTLLLHELDRMKQRRANVVLPSKMVAMGMTSSPLNFWRYSVLEESGGLSRWSLDEVQFLLMRRSRGTITEHGVDFKGCIYLNAQLKDDDAFAMPKRHGRKQVTIAYDERLVDKVFITHIRDVELPTPYECQLNDQLDHQLDYFGRCFAEVHELRDKQARNNEDARQEEFDSTRRTVTEHEETVAEAVADTQGAPYRGSKAQQKRDLPAQRRAEGHRTEAEAAFRPNLGGGSTPDATREATPGPVVPDQPKPQAPVAPPKPALTAPRRLVKNYLDRVNSLSEQN